MHKQIINDLINVQNQISDLRNCQSDLNKYQQLCFDTINNDLDNIRSFIMALKFMNDHENEFRSEKSSD